MSSLYEAELRIRAELRRLQKDLEAIKIVQKMLGRDAATPRTKRGIREPKDKHARHRHKLRALGLCVKCGEPSAPFYLCKAHREKKNHPELT